MRSDLGFATIAQRIAGLNTIGESIRASATAPGGAAPGAAPPADPATAQAFASTLEAQVQQALTAAGVDPTGGGLAGAPFGAPPAGEALQGAPRPPELGAGVRLHGQSSLILPQAPGPAGAAQWAGATGAVGGVGIGVDPAGGAYGSPGGVGVLEPPGRVNGPPALDRTGPPPELQAYGNGRIPTEALESVGVGDHALWSPAARAFRDMMAHAARDGVHIGVNDSYRSYERQVEMVERYGLYSQGGRAASPGTSNHGWGVSVDLQLDSRAQAWMDEHAREYGFVEDVPREPWHWTFKASSY